MTPLRALEVLDRHFLEARCKLLELAAILDRIDRGEDVPALDKDPRLEKINHALRALQDERPARAERLQLIFSLEYDSKWERPQPR